MTDSAALQKLVQILESARRTPLEGAARNLWHIEEIDLSLATLATVGVDLKCTGFGVLVLKDGSAPGARLRFTLNTGNDFRNAKPGDSITAPFAACVVLRETGSAAAGIVRLLVIDSPWANIALDNTGLIGAPTDLLGSIGATAAASTFVNVAVNTDPAGAAPAGAFDCTGWKRVRVMFDTKAQATSMTTFDVVPWFAPGGAAATLWSEQGAERVQVPDTNTSGGRYRSLIFNVAGRGEAYFAIYNALGVAVVGVGQAVQGIE